MFSKSTQIHFLSAQNFCRLFSYSQNIYRKNKIKYDPKKAIAGNCKNGYYEKFAELEEMEIEEEKLYSTQSNENIKKEIDRQYEYEKRRTIKNKFFRPVQKVNLLTWDAKEQIRYLNAEFPEEWTPERLSESFPSDVQGIMKIIDSSFTRLSERDLAKHDHRVSKALAALPRNPEPSLVELLSNSSGNSGLPRPVTPACQLQADEHIGTFQSIVKGYVDAKENRRCSANKKTKFKDLLPRPQKHLEIGNKNM